MAQASNLKISSVIKDLEKNRYLLPAIQREFVWGRGRICDLFDSLMRGYPIGTFLFWKIRPENINDYRFYAFMRYYHERDNYRCQSPDIAGIPKEGFNAVLDGQQRMTALYIGLRGYYAAKKPYGRWENDDAFPKTYLYVNLLHSPEKVISDQNKDEADLYAFEFKTKEDAEKGKAKGEWWFRCGRVCDEGWDIDSYLDENFDDELEEITFNFVQEQFAEKRKISIKAAKKILRKFDKAVNQLTELTYFSEDTDKLDRVLNIFIRLNSGGVSLSYSDLLLSIAIAQWKDTDAREEINKLRSEIWDKHRFDLSKDFILKACLMLSDISSVKFSVENFNKKNTEKLEQEWPYCREFLLLAVSLLRKFGYTSQNLAATNAILPIAYYLKLIQADSNYLSSTKYINDRKRLMLWFNRSILKQGVWGSSVDGYLSQLRETLRKEVPQKDGFDRFPYEEMLRSGRSLQFTADELDELLDLPKGKGRTFTLLSMLFPSYDDQIRDYHVDHIYPYAVFGRKKLLINCGYTQEEIDKAQWMRNMLPNLQLLQGIVNQEKSDAMPLDWLNTFPEEERKQRCQKQLLDGVTNNPKDFFSFFNNRREKLRILIAEKLGVPI